MLMSLNDKSSRNFLTRNIVETPQFEVSYRLRCQNHQFSRSGGFEIQTLKVKQVRVINEIFIEGYFMSVGVISGRNTISKLRLTFGDIKNSVFPKSDAWP